MTSPATSGGSVPMPRIGLEASVERIVPPEWTLAAFDPRLPAVFSTPAMIGMMEIAASKAVMPELPPGAITVGTRIEVDHLKAVPAGTNVRTTARLVEYRGRFLVFDVETRARIRSRNPGANRSIWDSMRSVMSTGDPEGT